MPLWLGSILLHGTKVSHAGELSIAEQSWALQSWAGLPFWQQVNIQYGWNWIGCAVWMYSGFHAAVMYHSQSSSAAGKTEWALHAGEEQRSEGLKCLALVTCWTFPDVGQGLGGWWSSDVLPCVEHLPLSLCCVYLETSFQSSGSTLKAGTSTVIWGLWNGWILCHSGFSWRYEILGILENSPVCTWLDFKL